MTKYRVEFRNESRIPDQYVEADTFHVEGNNFIFDKFGNNSMLGYSTVVAVAAFPASIVYAVRSENVKEA